MVLLGWHRGERSIQTKLQYARAMDANAAYTWVDDRMPSQHRIFHSRNLIFVPITTLDATGRPWGSLLSRSGEPGFITSPDDSTLVIDAIISDGDPIADNVSQGMGLVAGLGIELSTRRRNKFAGKIVSTERTAKSMRLTLKVNQALGNCPKYINVRALEPHRSAKPHISLKRLDLNSDETLPKNLISFIHQSDTVFLGTTYMASPEDAARLPSHLGMNHRGGRPGFVRVLNGHICVIPDYSGNRMMQSLGNIDATPLASLTFVDFFSGHILYLTGEAKNLVGSDARAIMPRANSLTTISITGYVFVEDSIAVRQQPGSTVNRSPYSPPIRFLTDETQDSQSLADVSVTLTRVKLHSPHVATFTFTSSAPVIIRPGQHAILDLTSLVGPGSYRHMAHEGLEASLNDDNIRTWTVSSSHNAATQTFDLTMKEKQGGAITSRLFNIARALSKHRPELMLDTTPLDMTVGLVGIGGVFTVPEKATKLLFVAGGIGITPFLSMLSAITSAEGHNDLDVILVISAREPQIAAELVQAAVGPPRSSLQVHIFSNSEMSTVDTPAIVMHQGRLDPTFFETIDDVKVRDVFVCGPILFEEMVIDSLQGNGGTIYRENFAY